MADNQAQSAPQMPPGYYPPYQQKKSRWWIPVVIVVGVLIVFFSIIIGIFSAIGSSFSKEPFTVKDNSVLYLDFGKVVGESPSNNPFNFLGEESHATFFDILTAIKAAKDDNRIKGIFFKSTPNNMGLARANEIQNALKDFKQSGKFIYAYIETGREQDYYFALPADKIYMPSEGILEMNGFGGASMFLKGFFDKLGIEFYVLGFEDFKSAGESLSRKNFSDSSRYQLQVILNQRLKMFVDAVVDFRKMDRKLVMDVLNRGVYSADSLKALGFIDEFAQESDVKDMLKEKIFGKTKPDDKDKKLRLVSVSNYTDDLPEVKKENLASEKNQIAIIFAEGSVMDEGGSPFSSEKVICTKEMVKYLKKAREDKDVKAIILRINSPGGSVITSDAIRDEIIKTKKVKPIFASMGDIAGSGGYYIPMACDTIIAHPATITGSIGVILAVPNFHGLLNKLDITVDTISSNPGANSLNGLLPYSDVEKKKLYNIGKPIYDRFIQKVAQHRHKTFEEAHALAKGRVWTGEDALKRGLVDVNGGLFDAISIVKKRIGVPEKMKVRVKIYPEPVDEVTALLRMFGFEKENDDASTGNFFKKNLSAIFGVSRDDVYYFYNSMPDGMKQQVNYMLDILGISQKERVIMAMPYYMDIN
ncbi:MAG: signal peptide peptidase SppA [Bacteroidetes bacterium]|nr:MAG: signal peptide peptidase SppA [Bacteroidota bacterium]